MCNRRMYWTSALLALALLAISGATARAETSLVGWWPLDDGAGTVASDASGNGRNGTFQGDPEWVAGHFGGALYFDGDDYVDTGFTDNLANWTVSCWAKSPAAPAAAAASGPFHREANFQINWNHTDVKFRAAVGLKAGTTWQAASFGTLEADTWYHLAGTYDGEDLKAYVNGKLITTNSTPTGAAANETASLKLGKHAKSAQYFTGTVDDARVYNGVLSQKDIQRIANGYSLDPVAWYKFDETSGTTAVDSAGGNNGTLQPAGSDGMGVVGPKWVAGNFDGGIEFDGGAGNVATNDYVDLPIGSLLSKMSSITITLWANWSGTGGSWQRIFDFGSGTSSYMFLTPSRSGTNAGRFAIRSTEVAEQIVNPPAILPTGWHHVAVAINSANMTIYLYVDGVMVRSGPTLLLPKDMGVTTQNWLARSQYPDSYYKGALDDFRIYDRALATDEVVNVMGGGPGYGVVNSPVPADKATDVLRDQTLSWKAPSGIEAQTYDVYVGTVRDDVANASSANPLGVLASAGQAATTYNPGHMEFGKSYYWRVDQVGPAPDFKVVKGNVWTFTVEPVAYTIAKASITATASSSDKDTMGPGRTVDESGLINGLHSTLETDMWLSSKLGPEPAWIQYAFDKVYSLNDMLVWNYNSTMESIAGYGAMDVTVEYSVDGSAWTKLGDVQFAQALGEPNGVAGTQVDFKGVAAQFVKLTINSNWGGIFAQCGLSEVRFSRFPATAINPSPASGKYQVVGPVTLTWRPGRDAGSHEVYLGTDKSNLPLVATVSQPSYEATVEQGKVYYWQIVEVNEAKQPPRWPSDVWNFETKGTPQDPGVASLAALYAMEDNADDSSGNSLNGTLSNGPVFVDGKAGMGKALSFDGTDDFVTLPIGDLLSTLSDITVATWTDFSQSGGAWQRVWDFGSGSASYIMVTPAQAGTGPLTFAVKSATVAEKRFAAPARLALGWHHVAVTINSATMTGRLYLDGAIVSSSSIAVLPKDLGVTTQNWIGKSQYSSDAYYKGSVDDLRIYKQALSQSEIMYLAGQR